MRMVIELAQGKLWGVYTDQNSEELEIVVAEAPGGVDIPAFGGYSIYRETPLSYPVEVDLIFSILESLEEGEDDGEKD